MGNAQSSAGTRFTGSHDLPTAQSCQVLGAPELYGTGIRVGFYLQYAAAIIAVLFGSDRDLRRWRSSFAVVAAAVFVSLCVNSTGPTLVIVDWAVVMQLVLWFPLFLAFPLASDMVLETENKAPAQAFQITGHLSRRRGQVSSDAEDADAAEKADVEALRRVHDIPDGRNNEGP